jgi:hypothetical protein
VIGLNLQEPDCNIEARGAVFVTDKEDHPLADSSCDVMRSARPKVAMKSIA